MRPRIAPSLVPLLFAGEISASRSVFIIRGESEGYVVECCVRRRDNVWDADVRRWVA